MLKHHVCLILILFFTLQSLVTVADVHQSHQNGSEHLSLEHLTLKHNLSEIETHDDHIADHHFEVDLAQEILTITDPHVDDCQHCCHCHSLHIVIALTNQSLTLNTLSASHNDVYYVGEYLTPIESSFRPPRI